MRHNQPTYRELAHTMGVKVLAPEQAHGMEQPNRIPYSVTVTRTSNGTTARQEPVLVGGKAQVRKMGGCEEVGSK